MGLRFHPQWEYYAVRFPWLDARRVAASFAVFALAAPAFHGSAESIGPQLRERMTGVSWHRGCPVGLGELRLLRVTHWGFDGEVHRGRLVVHRDSAGPMLGTMRQLFRLHYPIRRMRLVDAYGADDHRSMAADNTSAFNCRRAVATGPPSWSRHAYGRAIDVNPVENPYLFGSRVLPPAGAEFTGRKTARRGLIRRRDPIHQAFLAAGYRWGGAFSNPDYQHFDR
jgi:D-alanyl-D-alanine carboxypeptidase-like protein